MVFAQRFRTTGDSGTAFGANLLGAILGGVLEYLSLIAGYRWLLVAVALLYGLAFITGRGHLRAVSREAPSGSPMTKAARLSRARLSRKRARISKTQLISDLTPAAETLQAAGIAALRCAGRHSWPATS